MVEEPIVDAHAGIVPEMALSFGTRRSAARAVDRQNPLPALAPAALYADASIATLSADKAAGTEPVLPPNPARRGVMIVPPVDCRLTLAPGAAGGWPLFAGVPNSIAAPEVPANALYLAGLPAGASVTIWEG